MGKLQKCCFYDDPRSPEYFLYNVSAYIDQSIFSPLMLAKGAAADSITEIYGVFSGQYMVLINIPVALANATSTAMMPEITANYATGDVGGARSKINEAIRMTMFIAIPAAFGLAVLAYPIMDLLFAGSPDEAGTMLIVGAVSVLFYSLSTITNGVLQGIGKQYIPLRNAAVSPGCECDRAGGTDEVYRPWDLQCTGFNSGVFALYVYPE